MRLLLSSTPRLVVAAFLLGTGVSTVRGDVFSYTVDPGRSRLFVVTGSIELLGGENVPVQPLAAGGFSAALMGQINADVTANRIAFQETTRVIPIEHDLYLPGPIASPSTPAPGSYAIFFATQSVQGFDVSSVLRGLEFSWWDNFSNTLFGGVNKTFSVTGTLWSVMAGVADLSLGNPPQTDLTTVPPSPNFSLFDGVLSTAGQVETLTVPISYKMRIFSSFDIITLNFEGTVVATRTVVGADGACCHGSTCSVVSASACGGVNQTFAGAGMACNATGVGTAPCCLADFNHVGGVTVQDIFDFLFAYFDAAGTADVNGGGVSVQDVYDYLVLYFGGCT